MKTPQCSGADTYRVALPSTCGVCGVGVLRVETTVQNDGEPAVLVALDDLLDGGQAVRGDLRGDGDDAALRRHLQVLDSGQSGQLLLDAVGDVACYRRGFHAHSSN